MAVLITLTRVMDGGRGNAVGVMIGGDVEGKKEERGEGGRKSVDNEGARWHTHVKVGR